jgi:hypothetical protein
VVGGGGEGRRIVMDGGDLCGGEGREEGKKNKWDKKKMKASPCDLMVTA